MKGLESNKSKQYTLDKYIYINRKKSISIDGQKYCANNLFRSSGVVCGLQDFYFNRILPLEFSKYSKHLSLTLFDIKNEPEKVTTIANASAKFNKIYKEKGNKNMNKNEIKNLAEKKITDYILTKIKNHFGITIDLKFTDKQYIKFLTWLKKYDKNFRYHVVSRKVGSKNIYTLGDVDFIVKIGKETFARVMTQTAIKNQLTDIDVFTGKMIDSNQVKMYIFGKETFKVTKLLNAIQEELMDIGCFKVSANKSENSVPDIYFDTLIGRSKDSVFLNDNIKEKILNHINKFFNNKKIYEKRNLNYKTGILLYGEPGTGKSTIANMIATEYNIDMVLINMSEFINLNIEYITTTINADDNAYVVVLEDIDCVIGDRESEEQDLENKKNVNKLLQFLDSTSSPSNVIFVATTNHIEKLDDAIKRAGRFDLIMNITDIDTKAAEDMCKSFGMKHEDTVELLKNNMVNGKINPAKLQNLILQKIEPVDN